MPMLEFWGGSKRDRAHFPNQTRLPNGGVCSGQDFWQVKTANYAVKFQRVGLPRGQILIFLGTSANRNTPQRIGYTHPACGDRSFVRLLLNSLEGPSSLGEIHKIEKEVFKDRTTSCFGGVCSYNNEGYVERRVCSNSCVVARPHGIGGVFFPLPTQKMLTFPRIFPPALPNSGGVRFSPCIFLLPTLQPPCPVRFSRLLDRCLTSTFFGC